MHVHALSLHLRLKACAHCLCCCVAGDARPLRVRWPCEGALVLLTSVYRFRMGMMRQKERQQIGADYFDFSQSIEISQHRSPLHSTRFMPMCSVPLRAVSVALGGMTVLVEGPRQQQISEVWSGNARQAIRRLQCNRNMCARETADLPLNSEGAGLCHTSSSCAVEWCSAVRRSTRGKLEAIV